MHAGGADLRVRGLKETGRRGVSCRAGLELVTGAEACALGFWGVGLGEGGTQR